MGLLVTVPLLEQSAIPGHSLNRGIAAFIVLVE